VAAHYGYHVIIIISYHIVNLKRQSRLEVGTDKPKLKVKMQSVSVRLLESQFVYLLSGVRPPLDVFNPLVGLII